MKRNPIIKKYVTKIRRRLWKRKHYSKNKEKINTQQKKWVKNNPEKKNEYDRNYRLRTKDKRKEYDRNYREINYEKLKKAEWLRRGLKTDNIDEVYKRYEKTTNCDLCCVILKGIGSTKKCMDHSHTTGLFRNILCQSCNIKRGEDN